MTIFVILFMNSVTTESYHNDIKYHTALYTIFMPPCHFTLGKPKSCLKNVAFTPSTLSSPEPSWQTRWHGFKSEGIKARMGKKIKISSQSTPYSLSLKHRPSHRYLDMRQECRTFKSAASRPSDWLLLVLATRTQRAALTKTDGKINE